MRCPKITLFACLLAASASTHAATLFSSFGGIDPGTPVGVPSQSFPDVPGYSNAGADDFTVPANGWQIEEIRTNGRYTAGTQGNSGPATSVNVYILGNSGALPDTTNLSAGAIFAAENIAYEDTGSGDFRIPLPGGGITLGAGNYWLVVQANQPLGANGQWLWHESADGFNSGSVFGNESAWVQFGDTLFAGACNAAWGARVSTCAATDPAAPAPAERDLAFELEGTVLIPGATVAPTSLILWEGGSTADFSIVLDAPPANGETVTVNISSQDVTEATVSPASIMFTAANYNIPQAITVTPGASGDGNDGDVMFTLNNSISANVASGYSAVSAASVTGTNRNIDGIKTIIVDPAGGLSVAEDGTVDATFNIELTQNPSMGTVTVPVSADANTLVSNGGPFAAMVNVVLSNTTPATVTVRGNLNNDIQEGDTPFSITTGSSTASDDAGYNGIDPNDVSGIINDDDVAGIQVTASEPLPTTEAGATATFDVVLNSEPTGDVTIPLSSSDTSEGTLSDSSLVFTAGNWDTPQTVTVTGVNDFLDDGDVNYQLIVGPANSSDPFYLNRAPGNINAVNADNDTFTPGVTVTPTSGLVTNETGTTATFDVVLDSEPLIDVIIPITSGDISEGLLSANGIDFFDNIALTFTAANWDTPQTVTARGESDAIFDGDVLYNAITGTAIATVILDGGMPAADPDYDGFAGANIDDVEITNEDIDEALPVPVLGLPMLLLVGLLLGISGLAAARKR